MPESGSVRTGEDRFMRIPGDELKLSRTIDGSVFNELVQTAALDLTPSEKVSLKEELDRLMSIISRLEAIPLDEKTVPVIHGNPYPPEIRCGLREDVWKPFDNAEEIVRQAPASAGGFIISPDVEHRRIG